MNLGEQVSYNVLESGIAVYASDEEQVGKVAHVLADEGEDVFDGIVIAEHPLGQEHRFVDADEVDRIYEHGVVLKLDRAACEDLPRPTPNPAVMRDDPAESKPALRHEKLMRAWDLISGNR